MRGHVSSYETKSGKRWRIVYDAPPGADGQRRRTTRRGFRTQGEADRALREVLGQVEDGTHVDPSKVTVGEYLTTWVAGARIRKTTRARYRQSVENHLVPHIGGIRLQALTADHLDACYRALEQSGGRKGEGLAPKTVRNAHGVVYTALKDAVARGHVVRNVAELARPHKLRLLDPRRAGRPSRSGRFSPTSVTTGCTPTGCCSPQPESVAAKGSVFGGPTSISTRDG